MEWLDYELLRHLIGYLSREAVFTLGVMLGLLGRRTPVVRLLARVRNRREESDEGAEGRTEEC